MKFYLSYWSGGYSEMNKNLINLFKLSVYNIKKHYGDCYLITDSKSKLNLNFLKFTSITTELDILNEINSHNWALGKLYSYLFLSQKKESFLHLDYDVFLWKDLPKNFLKESILVQQKERDDQKKYYNLDIIASECPKKYLMENINQNEFPFAYNMGVFGGSDFNFIETYSKSAIDFSLDKENQLFFNKLNKISHSCVPVICEQLYLKQASNYYKKNITCLIESTTEREQDIEATNMGYTHLQDLKNQETMIKKIQSRVDQLNL